MSGKFEKIIDEIAERGWSSTNDFLPEELISDLIDEINCFWSEGKFKPAGIGRGEQLIVRPLERKDNILWLDPSNLTRAQEGYLAVIEELRSELNMNFYLGLTEFEFHYAVYPRGSFYKKHLDQFKDVRQRIITCILYLNESWDEKFGGQLRIYDNARPEYYEEIFPERNRFVCFRSDTIYHEVLPTLAQRFSVTGWLKRKGGEV